MKKSRNIWLVTNAASGSVREETRAALHEACERSDLCVARSFTFPDEDIPNAAALDAAGIEILVTLAGDGTINAAVTALEGWSGAILALPGGTQNLIAKRLHGDADVTEVVDAFATARARRTRPSVVRTEWGIALAGLMVGPGTSWNTVREAIRDADPAGILSAAGAALGDTTGNPPVRIVSPASGDPEGYPIVELVPHEGGFDIAAYHARTGADLAAQTWALLRQEFREGPHDTLGPFDRVTLESADENGKPAALDLLIDGEPAHGDARVDFALHTCPVDLIATLGADAPKDR